MRGLQSLLRLIKRHETLWLPVVNILTMAAIAMAQQPPFNPQQSMQSESTKPNADRVQQIIVNADLVTLNVSVVDAKGVTVPGLEKEDFAVTENKTPQEITFFSDADLPLSVGIVFDVSGSMSGKKIERAKEALANFIQTSHPDDEYFLIAFNSQPQLLLDRSRDGDALIKKLSSVEPQGNTALYDASYLALERVMRGAYPKRAILIISDGQDNNSRYKFSQLRRYLMESDVIVYAIGINGPPLVEESKQGGSVLDELASVSGGRAFFPRKSSQMNEAFDQIAVALRHQYAIGYRPSNFTLDAKWHHVKVKVTPPSDLKRVFVRYRQGYYAVASPR